nr:hypothetical protein [uncultured Rhodopila sp.]
MFWLPDVGFDLTSCAAVLALLNLACGSLGLFLLKEQRRQGDTSVDPTPLHTLHPKIREHEQHLHPVRPTQRWCNTPSKSFLDYPNRHWLLPSWWRKART